MREAREVEEKEEGEFDMMKDETEGCMIQQTKNYSVRGGRALSVSATGQESRVAATWLYDLYNCNETALFHAETRQQQLTPTTLLLSHRRGCEQMQNLAMFQRPFLPICLPYTSLSLLSVFTRLNGLSPGPIFQSPHASRHHGTPQSAFTALPLSYIRKTPICCR